MTRVRVKGFKIFYDRHGKPRCYHRATGDRIDLLKNPLGSAEFFAECARITASKKAKAEPHPGTLAMLIRDYRKHYQFSDLASRTRQDYQNVFDYLKAIPTVTFTEVGAARRSRRFSMETASRQVVLLQIHKEV